MYARHHYLSKQILCNPGKWDILKSVTATLEDWYFGGFEFWYKFDEKFLLFLIKTRQKRQIPGSVAVASFLYYFYFHSRNSRGLRKLIVRIFQIRTSKEVLQLYSEHSQKKKMIIIITVEKETIILLKPIENNRVEKLCFKILFFLSFF